MLLSEFKKVMCILYDCIITYVSIDLMFLGKLLRSLHLSAVLNTNFENICINFGETSSKVWCMSSTSHNVGFSSSVCCLLLLFFVCLFIWFCVLFTEQYTLFLRRYSYCDPNYSTCSRRKVLVFYLRPSSLQCYSWRLIACEYIPIKASTCTPF